MAVLDPILSKLIFIDLTMEVIIDYFEDEYPVLIRPDKTVKENKKEIANALSVDEQYIQLYIGEEQLADDNTFLSYSITYHSHITLYYDNPNIMVTVTFEEEQHEVVVDYNKPAEEILNKFKEVCSEPLKEIDNSRFEIHLLGMVVDHNSILADCGVSHNDAVTLQLIPDGADLASAASPEAAQKIVALTRALQQEQELSAQYYQQLTEKDAEIAQYLSDIQERDETIAQLSATVETLQKKVDQFQANRFRRMEGKRRTEPSAHHSPKPKPESLKESAAKEWKMSEEDEDMYSGRYRMLDSVDRDTLLGEMSNAGLDDASARDIMKLIPFEDESAVYEKEFIVAMFLCQKAVDGKQLPSTLPPVLKEALSESSSYSSYSSYSESDSGSYSDYSDYSDYSESSSYSEYSDESREEEPRKAFTAFARKKRPTKVAPKKAHSPVRHAKVSWKMSQETRTKLETEVFPQLSGGSDEVDVAALEEKLLSAGVSKETIHQIILLVCPGMTSVTFPYFAVIAFILQKVQQGIEIPKRVPSPLKAMLPPPAPKNMWDLNEKKVEELSILWESVNNGNDILPLKEGKAAIQKVCKKVPVANQITKLVTSNETGFTKKQFIVGVFMAQKYNKGASISPFLPAELREFLKAEPEKKEEPLQKVPSDRKSVDSAPEVKEEPRAYRKPSRSVSSVHSTSSQKSKKSRASSVAERRSSMEEIEVGAQKRSATPEEQDKQWLMTKEDAELAKTKVFPSIARNNPKLSEMSTKAFFKSISLSDEEIDQIVNLVTNGVSYPLNATQFSVAFFIAQKVKQGVSLPSELPDSLKAFLLCFCCNKQSIQQRHLEDPYLRLEALHLPFLLGLIEFVQHESHDYRFLLSTV